MTLSSSMGNGAVRRRSKLTYEAYGAALTQMYWVRRRNYSMLQTGRFPEFDRMKAKDKIPVRNDAGYRGWSVYLQRKPEKYAV